MRQIGMETAVDIVMASERPGGPPGRWVYFGEDFLRMRRWEERLGENGRVSLAEALPVLLQGLRAQMAGWVTELGRDEDLLWWMSPLASRNPMQTPLFLELCYLRFFFDQLLPGLQNRVTVVCEEPAFAAALAVNLEARGVACRVSPRARLQAAVAPFVSCLAVVGRWVAGLGRLLALISGAAQSRGQSRLPDAAGEVQGPRVMLHTCLDDASLREAGRIHDRYFGALPDALRTAGYAVDVLPWLCNVTRPVPEAMTHLRRAGALIPYDHLTFGDYVSVVRRLWAAGRRLPQRASFQEMDVTPLIRREWRRARGAAPGHLPFAVYEPLIRRLTRQGRRYEAAVDTFENMAPERPLLEGFRSHAPSTVTIGYQHATLPRELMGYVVADWQVERRLIPDYVVGNGTFGRDVLVRQGFNEDAVRLGPSLRYTYLLDSSGPVGSARPRDAILVLLPLDLPAAVELVVVVRRSCRALGGEPRVVLRRHPMMTEVQLLGAAGLQRLEPGWEWGSGPLGGDLARAVVAVGAGTGALVDAAAAGIPVVCVGRELGFSYNPLGPWHEVSSYCATVPPADVVARFRSILSGTLPDPPDVLACAIRSSLVPLDEQSLKAFLP